MARAPIRRLSVRAIMIRPNGRVLLLLNLVVLAGQIWPEGAPPFARAVNITFLFGSLLFFAHSFRRAR